MISFICGIQNQKEKQKTPQNLSSYVQRLDLWLPEEEEEEEIWCQKFNRG